ncbi:MAG: Uncharacterised protein [Opitutia bacterium UBA7350]|nr:MAG: Uncharacterised protein [Opitutae bacterium UBA7350]
MKCPCKHCGVDFLPSASEASYCCGGCRAVATLLSHEGLEEFYARRDAPGQPVGELPKVRSAWAKGAQAKAELNNKIMGGGRLRLEVSGMTCAGCAWLIESLFERLDGGTRCAVSLSGGYLDLWWKSEAGFNLAEFVETISVYGYRTKAGSGGWLRAVPAPLGYFAMGLIFMLNTGMLAWLSLLSYPEENTVHSLQGWIHCFLVLSLFGALVCWAKLLPSLRTSRASKKIEA